MDSVITIPTRGDNLIYLYAFGRGETLVVDPSEASGVLRTLEKNSLSLKAILITHHHYDHTGGAAELKQRTGCTIIGSDAERIPGIDEVVEDGQFLTFGGTRIQVIATPGHTQTSVCYYAQPSQDCPNGILWTGDTLFVGGCGRLLECDAQTMWKSLSRLASLPDETLIYCGHDYTLENCEFALSIEPGSEVLKRRLSEIRQVQNRGGLTVPSTIAQEKSTNPFLRADEPPLRATLGMERAQAAEVFAKLRRLKDVF